MNIEERKNKDLIFKLIELSDLINGRNNLENDSNRLIDDIKKIEAHTEKHINDFNTTVNIFIHLTSLDNFLCIGHYYDFIYREKKTDFIDNLTFKYNEVLEDKFKKLLKEIKEKYCEIIDCTPNVQVDKEYDSNYGKLVRLVFETENNDLINRYKSLHEKIVIELSKYNFTNAVSEEVNKKEYGIVKNMTSIINKENILLSLEKIKKRNGKIIAHIQNKIKDITSDIEKQFITLIPKKYIFNESFRNYAIECLFYERCSTIGEVINLYENFELHNEANITIRETLDSLNNLQATQFHQLMEISRGINDIVSSVDSLNDDFGTLSYDIKDISYTNERRYEEILESNNNINNNIIMGIESTNSLRQSQLDNLDNISRESVKIGKNIYEVKEFTDRFRSAKAIEGKYYY